MQRSSAWTIVLTDHPPTSRGAGAGAAAEVSQQVGVC